MSQPADKLEGKLKVVLSVAADTLTVEWTIKDFKTKVDRSKGTVP